jgi:HlyD family secretion protein/adhesin transport system membrane fusion protein
MTQDYFAKFDKSWSYRPVLLVGVACMICFFGWASMTKINEHVRATGRVIPSGKTRLIQHLEGGIVNEILVSEGENIKANDIIFYIKNQRAESELQELNIALSALDIKRLRLQAELDEKEPVYPEEMAEKYQEIIQSEKDLFAARRNEFEENVDGLEKRMKQKVLKLDELNTTVDNISKELSVAQEQLGIKMELRKKGAVSRSQYLDAVSAVRDFETRISKTQKEIPIVKSEISELTSLLEERRQKRFSEIGEELNKVKVDLRKIRERIEALNDQVERTAIRSPVDGVVNKIYINTIGGVIQPGGNLAEIIPLNETLIVEGRISTNDRGKVWPGLPVVAKITAYDYTLYGGIDGELTYISANSFIDNQNQQYYQVRISLDTTDFGEEKQIYPGMTAELNIIAGQISVLHSILKPFWNIRNNAFREK